MKVDKEKIRVLFWVSTIGLFFLSTDLNSQPITPSNAGTLKSQQNKSVASKISQDLMGLYKAHRAREREGSGEPGIVGQSPLPTSDGYVTIDAIASKDAQTLKRDMEALGLKNSGTFGRVVSGIFPIAEIPKLSDLESLKFARPALAQTHN